MIFLSPALLVIARMLFYTNINKKGEEMSAKNFKIGSDGRGNFVKINQVGKNSVPEIKRFMLSNGINRIKCLQISELTKHELKSEGFTCEHCK